jgi:predicted enzyme related to lactoylglutathione lyase
MGSAAAAQTASTRAFEYCGMSVSLSGGDRRVEVTAMSVAAGAAVVDPASNPNRGGASPTPVSADVVPGSYGRTMNWKIELIPVPVTDVDRAKAFYERAGFNADHDHTVHEGLRFVQLTPPGSACSIVIGRGITEKVPGTQEIQVVVADAEAARKQLLDAGIEASEVDVQPWGNFVYFRDPDGNRWSVQAIESRPNG